MNTTTCRYYRSGEAADLSIALHREAVRRGPGAPPYPVLERLDLTGLWLPVAARQGSEGFVELDGLEPIGIEEAADVYLQLAEMRLIPPSTPLPGDLAAAIGVYDEVERPLRPWLVVPLLLSGTLLVCLATLLILVLAFLLLS